VRIGAGTWLGTGAVVLPGSDIGRNVVVAAGAVVRGNVPDYAVVGGVPAKVVREYLPGTGWVAPAKVSEPAVILKPDAGTGSVGIPELGSSGLLSAD
jgi:carbonic anhydrase/acetyltransferase-like protein (isoleucine patch superfamily)